MKSLEQALYLDQNFVMAHFAMETLRRGSVGIGCHGDISAVP